jgi:uncharacterized membrane protein
MINNLLFVSTLVSALGCGLIAGVFFAFSTFVMKALASLPPAQGIAAMQSINVTVLNPWFLGTFLGTATACIFVVVSSLLTWHKPATAYLIVGSALYLFGTVLVTIAFNVPRNEALAAVDPTSADAASLWAGYVTGWTIWNHVRTAAALAAAAFLTVALCSSRAGAVEAHSPCVPGKHYEDFLEPPDLRCSLNKSRVI